LQDEGVEAFFICACSEVCYVEGGASLAVALVEAGVLKALADLCMEATPLEIPGSQDIVYPLEPQLIV
jgi:hypothetical protein